ncbi:hypothetical protein ACFX16_036131 [Malus domestica]
MDLQFGYVVVHELRNNFHEDGFAICATENGVILKSYHSLYVDTLLGLPSSNTHISFNKTAVNQIVRKDGNLSSQNGKAKQKKIKHIDGIL